MITGLHAILYGQQADSVRAFFREILEWPSVDAGHGWLIFAAPPTELAVHPTEGEARTELYLMCDDVHATVETLKLKGVEFTRPITDERWGLLTQFKLPDGSPMGLYQPKHAVAIAQPKAGSGAFKG